MESLTMLVPLPVLAGVGFLLITLGEEFKPGSARPSAGRTVLVVAVTLVLFGLGLFTAVIDPRHGSEVVGVPLLFASAVGAAALLLRLRRHLQNKAS